MDRIRDFLRDKGFLAAILACAAAALLVGVWAMHTIRQDLGQTQEPDGTSGADVAGLEPYPGGADDAGTGEDDTWNTGLDVAGRAEDVPEDNTSSSPKSSSASSSGQALSGGSSAGRQGSGAPAAAAAPSSMPPVSGSVIRAFSGDELVYNETLGDWRTHNGVDYACGAGDAVLAPVAGTVKTVKTDGNWGGVVELTDSEGRIWRLCGAAAPLVAAGDTVTAGQQLGVAGVIGCENAAGSHVHLEVLEGEKYCDPAELLG